MTHLQYALAVLSCALLLALMGFAWWYVITTPRYSRWVRDRKYRKHRERLYRKKFLPQPDVRAQRPTYDEWRKA